LSNPRVPNDLWCADYKGEFMLADRRYCYPLTISDFASRYLISCEALSTTQETYAFSVFERAFREFGLPKAIRTDNSVPFASPHALFGLSKLAVWWLRLGIDIERIKPGHPTQNGRHERIHLTLKKEATRPAAQNMLQQQARFDDFLDCYNRERPHQALDMKYPAELYRPSPRPYRGLRELTYPFHDRTITVTSATISSITQPPFQDGSHAAVDSLHHASGNRLDQESPDPLDSPPSSVEKRTGRISVIASLPSRCLVSRISCCASGRPAGITILPSGFSC
jgi:hypothetical protein